MSLRWGHAGRGSWRRDLQDHQRLRLRPGASILYCLYFSNTPLRVAWYACVPSTSTWRSSTSCMMLFFLCDEQVGGLNNLTFFDTMAMRIHHSEHFAAPAVNEHDECLRLEPRTNYVISPDGSLTDDVQPSTSTTSASVSSRGSDYKIFLPESPSALICQREVRSCAALS